MPELVRCPACGVRVQMSDAVVGKQVACFACRHRFVARTDVPAPPAPAPVPQRPFDRARQDELPLCPGCGRRVSWNAPRCPSCDEELEPEAGPRLRPLPQRRDWEPHRGKMLLVMGNVSLALGGLTLCTAGIASPLSVVLGAVTWWLAQRDLEEMRAGRMDPGGQSSTEAGRAGGLVGAILGLLLGLFFAALYLESWF
jgi:hypothetical protein